MAQDIYFSLVSLMGLAVIVCSIPLLRKQTDSWVSVLAGILIGFCGVGIWTVFPKEMSHYWWLDFFAILIASGFLFELRRRLIRFYPSGTSGNGTGGGPRFGIRQLFALIGDKLRAIGHHIMRFLRGYYEFYFSSGNVSRLWRRFCLFGLALTALSIEGAFREGRIGYFSSWFVAGLSMSLIGSPFVLYDLFMLFRRIGGNGGGQSFGRTRQLLARLKDKSDAIDRHIRFLAWRLLSPVWRSFIRDSVPWGIATTVAFTGLTFVKPLTAYYSVPGVVVPNDVGFSILAYALVGCCLFLAVHGECAEYDFYGYWPFGEETATWIRQKISRLSDDQTA